MSTIGNRSLNQFAYSMEADIVTLEGSFEVGTTGAVSNVQGGGIGSVTRTGTGVYDIVLSDGWFWLFGVDAQVVRPTVSAIAAVQLTMTATNAALQTAVKNKTALTITCVNYAGAAADPEDDSMVKFTITVRRSSVGYFDSPIA